MSDYLISVVDATSAFPTPKENREYQTSNLDDAYDKGWDDCQLYIGSLPPIDAVPVIRCKDCKHCVEGLTFWVRWLRCEQNRDAMKEVNDSDWCCWAERKES